MDLENTRNRKTIEHIYDKVLPALAQQIHQNITPVLPLFDNFILERVIDTWTKDPLADEEDEVSIENGNIQFLGLRLKLEGFQRAGVEAFDITKNLIFKLEPYSYTVGPDKNKIWLEKEYLQRWDQSEYQKVAEQWSEDLIDDITKRLKGLTE